MKKINTPIVVFWFRRDLRLKDNAGLFHALESGYPVLPLFIFDTDILSQLDNKLDRRVDFIHQALTEINFELASVGSSLCVKIGKPIDVFTQLTKEYDIKSVYTNRDYETYALQRDKTINEFFCSKSIDFLTFKDQVIFEANEILKGNGEPYTIFTPYSKIWKQNLSEKSNAVFLSQQLVNQFVKRERIPFPSLEEIGFQKTDMQFVSPIVEENIISTYDETRNFPAIEGTTRLSVHLRFGTISIRQLVTLAQKLNEQWLNELIWREFFMSILVNFPHMETGAFRKKYEGIVWRNNETEFAAWCEGKTGYPIVDAGMRQLNETG